MSKITGIRKLLAVAALALAPMASYAGVVISVGFGPPVLPVYAQPICPGDGYLWTPGYWAYGPEGYFWVPGVWVQPPTVGYLWTPGYWGWGGSAFLFHAGYWGPHVGFYGGINYGFGYGGLGYQGGYWNHGAFAYNRSVNNVNITNIHNVYNQNVTVNNNTRVAFNGGQGGLQARANAQEMQAEHEQHVQPTSNQMQHQQMAQNNRAQYANVNHGNPATPAMSQVGQRGFNQQQRIGQGINSGQITARGASNLENREANINQTANQDRRANGGTLTSQQQQNINQRQNNVSNQIYQDKHNSYTQPGVRPNNAAAQAQQQQRQQQQQANQQQHQAQQQQHQAAQQQHQEARPEAHQSGGEGGEHGRK